MGTVRLHDRELRLVYRDVYRAVSADTLSQPRLQQPAEPQNEARAARHIDRTDFAAEHRQYLQFHSRGLVENALSVGRVPQIRARLVDENISAYILFPRRVPARVPAEIEAVAEALMLVRLHSRVRTVQLLPQSVWLLRLVAVQRLAGYAEPHHDFLRVQLPVVDQDRALPEPDQARADGGVRPVSRRLPRVVHIRQPVLSGARRNRAAHDAPARMVCRDSSGGISVVAGAVGRAESGLRRTRARRLGALGEAAPEAYARARPRACERRGEYRQQ